MATQGTNENGSSMNKGRNGNDFKKPYQGRRTNGERTEDGKRYSKGEGRSGDRNGKFSKPGTNQNSKYNHHDGSRPTRPDRGGKGYNSVPKFAGKDDEEEDTGRRSKPSRPKESKPSVSIPDKNKTMMRLEKEQKGIKKKQQSKKKESSRPQPKVKRANNVNYARNYANGDYDDYDDYYDDMY